MKTRIMMVYNQAFFQTLQTQKQPIHVWGQTVVLQKNVPLQQFTCIEWYAQTTNRERKPPLIQTFRWLSTHQWCYKRKIATSAIYPCWMVCADQNHRQKERKKRKTIPLPDVWVVEHPRNWRRCADYLRRGSFPFLSRSLPDLNSLSSNFIASARADFISSLKFMSAPCNFVKTWLAFAS